jgi:hypothetical protein
VSPLELARVHVGLGEHDRALTLLEQAASIGASTTVMLNVEPAFDPLRREPRVEGSSRRSGRDARGLPRIREEDGVVGGGRRMG